MILLLAGTTEARKLSWLLNDYGLEALASLAGETAEPEKLGIPTRVGGFGGAMAFRAFLDDNNVSAVVDATHPFAVSITRRTARICEEKGVPYMQLERPMWEPEPDDEWWFVDDLAEAGKHIPEGAKVFAAVGRKAAEELDLPNRELYVRTVDPQEDTENIKFITGRPPFSQAEEVELFKSLGIDWIIAKNSGGATDGKLLAARELHLPVLMQSRPKAPVTQCRERVQDVLDWLLDL
ncbi:precorrin-6A reductase [Marivivens aquimaris]|uniref:precorrin-6A reductase n=1 Tax=Marivivens aquimaris TaxID=2774876 RepID=UPI00187F2EFF|nr:precorrin-6A reductase [Marivivens aquimaris]